MTCTMIPDFDENGNLPPGDLIKPTIHEFEERFVTRADAESTRKYIFDRYNKYCDVLRSLDIASIQWVDGSYTTQKPNPRDIDIVIHFDGMKIHHDKVLQERFGMLIDVNNMKHRFKCHPQFDIRKPDFKSYDIVSGDASYAHGV